MEEQSTFFSRWKLPSFSKDETTEYQHATSGKPSLGVRTLLRRRERTVAGTNQSIKETAWFQCQYLSDIDARSAGKVYYAHNIFQFYFWITEFSKSLAIVTVLFPLPRLCLVCYKHFSLVLTVWCPAMLHLLKYTL